MLCWDCSVQAGASRGSEREATKEGGSEREATKEGARVLRLFLRKAQAAMIPCAHRDIPSLLSFFLSREAAARSIPCALFYAAAMPCILAFRCSQLLRLVRVEFPTTQINSFRVLVLANCC